MDKPSRQIVTAGLLMATGLILPMVFHTFALGGPVFLPMHIPILLGGFLLTPFYALLVGTVTPLLSSVLTGMPPLFPSGIQMIFELATYGFVTSLLYRRYRDHLYPVLIGGMLAGRLVAGVVNYLLLTHYLAKAFQVQVFLAAMFVTAFPGILIQLVMIPAMVKLLINARILQKKETELHER